MLSLMKKDLHLYLDLGTWFINLPARVLLRLKMFLVVQVLYLNLGKAQDELEKLSLLDLTFNFIELKEQGMRLNFNINVVLILKRIQILLLKLWLLRKEAIQDEIDSIMHNNTWVFSYLPPGCKAIGSKRILRKEMNFNFENYSPISTSIDPNLKVLPNKGSLVSQREYSKAIACLMYATISIRPDMAFVVGKSSRYTTNPSTHHWQEVNRTFKYLKGTKDYGLIYIGHPSILESYSNSSGWLFLPGGGAISWASKKQTCITNSTMESDFVAFSTTGKKVEWLRKLIYEIPLWPKLISNISIKCNSAVTLAKLNFPDRLTKGLTRDLVHKAFIEVGLKST
uniref:Reverse transcriptase Ty1/copia-type domain-containing protein n=1 Tax=Lactuca sativa TaxID=4236 RepID=A0A9R1V062_LACSA|nr:hypothetical protein LSAT_V11C700348530 [Lactuca sativa]